MSIDASKLVNIVPRVIDGGGNSLEFNGLILSKNPLIPAGKVLQWADATSATKYFGQLDPLSPLIAGYFKGYDNSTRNPTLLYTARYVDEPVAAWLRGGSFTGTLAGLKTVINGGMVLSIDSTAISISGVNLSTANSFSDVADILQSFLVAQLAGVRVTYSSLTRAFQIYSPTTGENSNIDFAAAPGEGTDLSALLLLTEQAGALISLGMEAQTPAQAMENILLNYTRNWVLFMTDWEPDFAGKMAFARWVNDYRNVQNGYVAWDTDIAAINPMSEASFGAQVQELELSGTACVYNTPELAAFVLSIAACIDWNEHKGKLTWAFKTQGGLAITCDDTNAYEGLEANGYNCYADFHTANDSFKFLQNGQISGPYKWIDTYCEAIAIRNDLQLCGMDLFKTAKALPYNQEGYDRLETASLDVRAKYKNFGAIASGVPLSNAQAAQVNTEAGKNIAETIMQEGDYLQILPATAQVRSQRGSPPMKYWYTSGGSIQQIDMPSTTIL